MSIDGVWSYSSVRVTANIFACGDILSWWMKRVQEAQHSKNEKWYQAGATDTSVRHKKKKFDRVARTQMIRRFEAKECDWLERVTSLEADLEGLRAEAVETRGRLRRAEESSPSADVFER